MKKALVLCAGCLLAGVTVLQAQPADTLILSLQEAVIRSVEVSPEVGIERAGKERAAALWSEARASRFLPQFQVTTAHSMAPGLKGIGNTPSEELYLNPSVRNDWDNLGMFNRIEAEVVQPLYTWGELSESIRAAQFGVDVEDAGMRNKAQEVALRTGELYNSVLLTEELYRLTDRAGEIVEQAKREINRLLQEGDEGVDNADLFQVEITEQEYFRRVVEVEQQRTAARSALGRQLFLPDGQLALTANRNLMPYSFELDTLSAYMNLALQNRPELAQARAGLAARDALVKVAEAKRYPTLFAGVQAGYSGAPGREFQPSPYVGDPFSGRTFQAGIGFRQNLNFSQTRARIEQARAQRNEVEYQQDAARQLILFEVEEAYRNVIVTAAALDAQDKSLTISKEWLRTELVDFEFDLGDTENLVKAVQSNLTLEAGYYDAVQRYNVAVLRLLHRCGVLVTFIQDGTLVEP